MRIVFDLDGTLADGTHREHFIAGETKDWDAYFEACDGDTPIHHAIDTLIALARDDHDIEIWSGRGVGLNYSVYGKTRIWLGAHADIHTLGSDLPGFEPTAFRVDCIGLRMRDHADHTPDHELKRRWLNEARADGRPPELVFDDRNRVVAMWRDEGIPCFQVAPGDF
ncbi:MAG: hypothetical protein OXC08_16005 [Thiotrichales bacterium]|nr:hypothetical protein [Thiotrichales bacterium]